MITESVAILQILVIFHSKTSSQISINDLNDHKKIDPAQAINMSHYKRDQASNRDALFGGAGSSGSGGGGGRKARPSSTRSAASPTSAAAAAPRPSPRNNAGIRSTLGSTSNTPANDPQITPGPSAIFGGKIASRNRMVSILNGQAKIDKMAEAEDNRLKAKQAMTRGIFSKPDPISAANFYKRAADAYKACGENRLER